MLIWKWGKALLSNFSNRPQKGYVEIEPDAGIPFRRQIFSDVADLVTASFSLTRENYIKFMSWYKYELRQGSLPFLFYDCRYKRDRVARLIGGVPEYQTNSKRINLSVNLAFEPLIIKEDKYLTVDNNIALIVNGSDKLIVNYEMRA